ncbi:conserved hypothetical protein [Neospora caninum Liverpool]|uniref:ICE family protease (Caspase) p20 domain-containing protein n=1 Tax=Neospora caninum (strain Liverpool) TaxID=572307 RepID=F0VE72_NEOCL|nr:conserved hypothetical protein [Neospora caninum Liverpool]CBZ52016.1 conserved hypothetical protein [Neospora caninum Liverpool]|eukprot:XP_003882048.1 conserved hypothetical protein [Neospora caninum Liverpool]
MLARLAALFLGDEAAAGVCTPEHERKLGAVSPAPSWVTSRGFASVGTPAVAQVSAHTDLRPTYTSASPRQITPTSPLQPDTATAAFPQIVRVKDPETASSPRIAAFNANSAAGRAACPLSRSRAAPAVQTPPLASPQEPTHEQKAMDLERASNASPPYGCSMRVNGSQQRRPREDVDSCLASLPSANLTHEEEGGLRHSSGEPCSNQKRREDETPPRREQRDVSSQDQKDRRASSQAKGTLRRDKQSSRSLANTREPGAPVEKGPEEDKGESLGLSGSLISGRTKGDGVSYAQIVPRAKEGKERKEATMSEDLTLPCRPDLGDEATEKIEDSPAFLVSCAGEPSGRATAKRSAEIPDAGGHIPAAGRGMQTGEKTRRAEPSKERQGTIERPGVWPTKGRNGPRRQSTEAQKGKGQEQEGDGAAETQRRKDASCAELTLVPGQGVEASRSLSRSPSTGDEPAPPCGKQGAGQQHNMSVCHLASLYEQVSTATHPSAFAPFLGRFDGLEETPRSLIDRRGTRCRRGAVREKGGNAFSSPVSSPWPACGGHAPSTRRSFTPTTAEQWDEGEAGQESRFTDDPSRRDQEVLFRDETGSVHLLRLLPASAASGEDVLPPTDRHSGASRLSTDQERSSIPEGRESGQCLTSSGTRHSASSFSRFLSSTPASDRQARDEGNGGSVAADAKRNVHKNVGCERPLSSASPGVGGHADSKCIDAANAVDRAFAETMRERKGDVCGGVHAIEEKPEQCEPGNPKGDGEGERSPLSGQGCGARDTRLNRNGTKDRQSCGTPNESELSGWNEENASNLPHLLSPSIFHQRFASSSLSRSDPSSGSASLAAYAGFREVTGVYPLVSNTAAKSLGCLDRSQNAVPPHTGTKQSQDDADCAPLQGLLGTANCEAVETAATEEQREEKEGRQRKTDDLSAKGEVPESGVAHFRIASSSSEVERPDVDISVLASVDPYRRCLGVRKRADPADFFFAKDAAASSAYPPGMATTPTRTTAPASLFSSGLVFALGVSPPLPTEKREKTSDLLSCLRSSSMPLEPETVGEQDCLFFPFPAALKAPDLRAQETADRLERREKSERIPPRGEVQSFAAAFASIEAQAKNEREGGDARDDRGDDGERERRVWLSSRSAPFPLSAQGEQGEASGRRTRVDFSSLHHRKQTPPAASEVLFSSAMKDDTGSTWEEPGRKRETAQARESSGKRWRSRDEDRPPMKRALCVGCNYLGKFCQLDGAAADCLSVANVLRYDLGFDSVRCLYTDKTLTGPTQAEETLHSPTKANILRHLVSLVEDACAGDVILFFFSGCGAMMSPAHPYFSDISDSALLPDDFESPGVPLRLIFGSELKAVVDSVAPGVQFCLIFDCCHAQRFLPALSGCGFTAKKREIPSHSLKGPSLFNCSSGAGVLALQKPKRDGYLFAWPPSALPPCGSAVPPLPSSLSSLSSFLPRATPGRSATDSHRAFRVKSAGFLSPALSHSAHEILARGERLESGGLPGRQATESRALFPISASLPENPAGSASIFVLVPDDATPAAEVLLQGSHNPTGWFTHRLLSAMKNLRRGASYFDVADAAAVAPMPLHASLFSPLVMERANGGSVGRGTAKGFGSEREGLSFLFTGEERFQLLFTPHTPPQSLCFLSRSSLSCCSFTPFSSSAAASGLVKSAITEDNFPAFLDEVRAREIADAAKTTQTSQDSDAGNGTGDELGNRGS